jgi:hypothetical protein
LIRFHCLVSVAGILVACANPEPNNGQLACSPDGDPVFLASKLDDDDGDGNPFDEDFPTINDEDDDIADHAWVQDDQGLYHLYFQNEGHSGTFDIEHYTSSDLQTLQYVGVALRANPAGWDSRGLWAPHVVRLGDTWFLFYAGVNGTGPQSQQRIGLAVSQDLHQWTRVVSQLPLAGDGAIYDCRETWTTWGSGQNFDDQCRDPFVIWDATQQRWVLFATARSIDGYAVVTVATTTNLLDWTGQGYIDATRRLPNGIAAQRTGGEAENPFVVAHNGTYYLLFTDWRDPEDDHTFKVPRTIVQYATSTTLMATADGSPHWIYRGSTPDPGVNAIEVQRLGNNGWLMSQSVSNEASGDGRLFRSLRLMCVTWQDDLRFTTQPFRRIQPAEAATSPTEPTPSH